MKHFEKSWSQPLSGHKKFIAAMLSHSLSKLLNRRIFEVVNESFIDLQDWKSEQPDVIVYDIKDEYKPAMLIEFTDHAGLDSTIRTMEILSDLYHVPEAFIFDFETQKWFRINGHDVQESASSEKFGFNLQNILSQSLLQYSN